jgi:Lanthionine synthetase C-like protein
MKIPEELLDQAKATIVELALRAEKRAAGHASSILASGDLGLVIGLALVERHFGWHAQLQQLRRDLLLRSWEVLASDARLGFYTGSGGAAWLIGSLTPDATPEMTRWASSFFARVSADAQATAKRRHVQHFDVIDGYAGILTAASLAAASPEEIGHIAAALSGFFSSRDGEIELLTPAARVLEEAGESPGTRVQNFGVAHGLTGALAALAASLKHIESSRVRELVEWGCTALLLHLEREVQGVARFPGYYVDSAPVIPRQLAWCYGPLPAVLLLLELGVGNPIVGAYLDSWRREFRPDWASYASTSHPASFCHGTAGVGYSLGAIAHRCGCDRLWSLAVSALRDAALHAGAGHGREGFLAGPLGFAVATMALARIGSPSPARVLCVVDYSDCWASDKN